MVNSISSATGSSALAGLASNGASATSDVDFNTFLKLLVTQLKNQDPLNPMEGTEFTAQIATFSQLEQQINTNNKLESLLSQQSYGERALAVSYIGKEALVPSTTLSLGLNEQTESFAFDLADAAQNTVIQIRNEAGALVKEIDGSTAKGLNYVTWDGTNTAGELLPAGDYKVNVSATNADGKSISAKPHTYVAVNAVEADGGDISLILADNTRISFASVASVRGQE